MASRQSMLPSFLYAASSGAGMPGGRGSAQEAPVVVARAPSEPPFGKIDMFSPAYYAACGFGGAAACGLTHAAVTPLDVIKCNIQIDPAKYKSISSSFSIVLKEQGVRGFFRGWAPTFLGYSAQGAFKYGLYEVFKKEYTDMAGPEYAAKYKTLIYLAGSATAEVVADVALCPMEAVKVRVQTQPGYARGLRDGFPKIVRAEGYAGLFRGMVPLWGRQIPFRDLREHRGDGVQAPHPHPEGAVQQASSARGELRERLYRRSLLRRHLAPRRQPGLLPQQCQGRHRRRRCQEPRPLGTLHARPSAPHRHDRHTDRYPVGDL